MLSSLQKWFWCQTEPLLYLRSIENAILFRTCIFNFSFFRDFFLSYSLQPFLRNSEGKSNFVLEIKNSVTSANNFGLLAPKLRFSIFFDLRFQFVKWSYSSRSKACQTTLGSIQLISCWLLIVKSTSTARSWTSSWPTFTSINWCLQINLLYLQ
jgi:hypothetical protein